LDDTPPPAPVSAALVDPPSSSRPLFSFGSAAGACPTPPHAAPKVGSPLFGASSGPSAAANPKPFFSFGAPEGATAAPPPAECGDGGDGGDVDGDGDGDDDGAPRRPPLVVAAEPDDDPATEVLASVKCKLYRRAAGGGESSSAADVWNEVGVGFAAVRRPRGGEGSGGRFLTFRRSEGGKVLLTAPLHEGCRVDASADAAGKRGLARVFEARPDRTGTVVAATEATTVLFRTGTREAMDRLATAVRGGAG